MSDAEIEFPWVNYGASDKTRKDRMTELTTQKWSPFNGYDNAAVFIFCMSYAFAKNKTPVPPSGSQGSMPPSAFKTDMRDMMRSLAIAKAGELRIIKKSAGKEGYVKICESYANSGFDEIYNKLKNRDSSISPENVLNGIFDDIESKRKEKN